MNLNFWKVLNSNLGQENGIHFPGISSGLHMATEHLRCGWYKSACAIDWILKLWYKKRNLTYSLVIFLLNAYRNIVSAKKFFFPKI